MRVLVAPDKFRGTLSATQAASAIAAGWRRARPQDEVDVCPIADGGDGTMATLLDALDGRAFTERVTGPRRTIVEAAFGIATADGARTAIVESASASGLVLVAPDERDVGSATTAGTGELILAALDHEPERLLLCVGGTASLDGGAGMAQALGVRLARTDGSPIGPGGRGLLDLASIDLTTLDPRLRSVEVEACVDVDNPLLGPAGAAVTFGPQKGAGADEILVLDRALGHLAAVVHRDLGIDLRERRGMGAGGGLPLGAVAFLGARLRSGSEVVAEALGLGTRIGRADLVLTGEGRFDRTTLGGKGPGLALRLAGELGVSAGVLCGEAEPGAEELVPGLGTVVSLVDRFGSDTASTEAYRSLTEVAAELADTFPGEGKDTG